MATGTRPRGTDTASEREAEQKGVVDRPPKRRRGMPAGRVLITILTCLFVWTVLFAPELKRSSEAQPLGVRRTVSLAILSPIAWVSDHVGLTHLTDSAERALGRDPNEAPGGSVGGIPFEVDPIPPVQVAGDRRHRDDRPPVHDTQFRVASGEHRLRVDVVGDSLAAGIGVFAERVFKPFLVDVKKYGTISTGLARPDFFNWPAAMQQIVDGYRPDLTIVMLGENDNQSLQTAGGEPETPIGTFPWAAAYEARVERFAKIATGGGGHVVWVGLPMVRDTSRWEFIQRENAIYQAVADRLPNVAYLDTWDLFASRDGGYSAYFRESGGSIEQVREDDGVHFNGTGYTIVMQNIAQLATTEFGLETRAYEG
jgi:lysophospholipase L1-like esterase